MRLPRFLIQQPVRHFTDEATELFSRFALRHGLKYQVLDAPVEVLWAFPEQQKLSNRIVLGLQNNDELNFGVGEFWSYFFPYLDVAVRFESLIDAWVEGRARTVPVPGLLHQTIELQILEDGEWKNAYGAGSITFKRRSPLVLKNEISSTP